MAAKTRPEKDKSTITLKESQRISLSALEMERQRFDNEIKQLQVEIQRRVDSTANNKAAMQRILVEIENENELARGSLGSSYLFDGEKFIQAGN